MPAEEHPDLLRFLKKRAASSKARKGVALALNSSYFGFFAHAGFVYEMDRLGLHPKAISGASAGAIVAGLYAAGVPPDRMLGLLLALRLWRSFVELSSLRRLFGLLANRHGTTGLISGEKLLRLLERELGDMQIEDCPTARLAISAANMTQGRQELLERGNLARSILASSAVPGMFAAQRLSEHSRDLYWDGGIADPVPIEHWVEDDSIDRILIHLVLNESDLSAKREAQGSGLFRFRSGLSNTHRIISDEIFRMKCRMLREAGKEVLIFRTVTPLSGPHRLHLGGSNVRLGRNTARQLIGLDG